MQIFIWKRTGGATWRHHDEAGVVIVALNLPNARHLFKQWQKKHNCYDERCGVYLLAPDRILPTVPTEHTVYVFADAGCC